MYSSKRMADGKQWTTHNLDVKYYAVLLLRRCRTEFRRYGRLYTWESGRRACQLLGTEWRLPTNDEWRQMTKQYGGLRDDSDDGGKAATTRS